MRIAVFLRTCVWRVYLHDDVIAVFVVSNITGIVCSRLSVNAVDGGLEARMTTVVVSTGSGLIPPAASWIVPEATAGAARACVTQEVATHRYFRFRVDGRHLDNFIQIWRHVILYAMWRTRTSSVVELCRYFAQRLPFGTRHLAENYTGNILADSLPIKPSLGTPRMYPLQINIIVTLATEKWAIIIYNSEGALNGVLISPGFVSAVSDVTVTSVPISYYSVWFYIRNYDCHLNYEHVLDECRF